MSNIETFLYAILAMLVVVVIGLIIVFIIIKNKEKNVNNNNSEKKEVIETAPKSKIAVDKTKVAKEYEAKSIFDFMEFESVKDNMIVQKNGKQFLMAIECKGINYDLMSEVEKNATEQGFASFLNTIREPIQIYIQTRTVNLEKNIEKYKDRVDKIRDSINLKEFRLKEYEGRASKSEKVLKDKQFELFREKNLYSYGQDIVTDTKRMSLNKNVLKKKYYIILKYYYEAIDAGEDNILSEEEVREVAFSNLYTKALSMTTVLSGIGVIGKVLNSYELIELLYNAYNRDDSEVFGIDKAIESGYDEIYVDSQSIIDKKIDLINKEIQSRAQEIAQKALDQVKDERDEELKEIEDNIDSIIENLAKEIIRSENNNIPEAIQKEAIEKIENNSEKKGVEKSNGKKDTKETSRKRRAG